MALRTVAATRYVTPLREGGSLPALFEADDDGLYVVKMLGAGHGRKALTAELIAGEIARSLGLPVPEIVLVELDPVLGMAEPDPEIRDLVVGSGGINLGLDFLPGALPFSPAVRFALAPELAANIVWFDALVTNIDREPRNPNLLVWHQQLWLIDHGSALYIHHTWRDPAEHARRPFPAIKNHILLPRAGSIEAADDRMSARLSEQVLKEIVESVPEDWLSEATEFPDTRTHRNAYLEYLLRRLESPRPFVAGAERARAEA